MASGSVPNKYQRSDVLQTVLGSRTVLAIVFTGFLGAGVLCVYSGGTVSVSIGTSFIAGALISLATLLIDQIRNGEQLRAADLAQAGLLAAYERRDLPEYDGLVAAADQIDVAGYTLKSFSETNESALRHRAKTGHAISVRILLVDPHCDAARVMEHSEGLSSGGYSANFESLKSKLTGIPDLEIKTIPHHLPMMIYRIDQILYTGPFPIDGRSRMAITLKLGLNGWLFERQLSEFNALWAKATPISTLLPERT